MNIAVWHNLFSGGGKRALHMHVKGLHERGHKIHIFSTTQSDRHYLPLTPFSESETLLPLPEASADRRRQWLLRGKFHTQSAEDRIQKLNKAKQHAKQCGQLINASNCTVLLANSCQNTYNSPIGTAVDLPSLSYLQEPYRPLYEASPELPWLLPTSPSAHPRNPLKRLQEQSRQGMENHSFRLQLSEELRWARSYTRILCNSQYSRESILRAYHIDPKVCYLGIDSEAFRPRSESKEPFALCVGSIHYTKRLHAAIRTIATIPCKDRPTLVLAGNFADEGYKSYLLNLANELQVNLRHHVLLSDHELQEIMSRAACFLYTSHLEPFGLTPLEANACGTAVVAIGEGGVRETVHPGINGYLALDCDYPLLAEYVHKLTSDLDHAATMGAQAREHVVRHWSVQDAVDRIEQHLLQVAH
jgi:glycosyltransferase involved in cell wall biosynthesis